MRWTASDSDALLHWPSGGPADDHIWMPDGSLEAMRRLRFPFEADPADVLDQQRGVPVDENRHRR